MEYVFNRQVTWETILQKEYFKAVGSLSLQSLNMSKVCVHC